MNKPQGKKSGIRLEHIAIWTTDLERLKAFYMRYFNATSSEVYVNADKQFSSYFLTFSAGARLELMQHPGVSGDFQNSNERPSGYAHIAVSVGSNNEVDTLTSRMINDGIECIGMPRTTGDGYYESVVLDPDGNQIEITS